MGRSCAARSRSCWRPSRSRRRSPGRDLLFDIVFVLVVIDPPVTAPTLPWVAKVLRVARRSEPRDIVLEAAPLDRVAADMLQVAISPKSRLHGVEVGELRLPPGASVALIVREGQALVPEIRTVLRHGDDLLVVTPRKLRDATEKAAASGERRRPARPMAGRRPDRCEIALNED